jgi:predicted GTPase
MQGVSKEDTNKFLQKVKKVHEKASKLLPGDSLTVELYKSLVKQQEHLEREPLSVALCGGPGAGKSFAANTHAYPQGEGKEPLYSGKGIGHHTAFLQQLRLSRNFEVKSVLWLVFAMS